MEDSRVCEAVLFFPFFFFTLVGPFPIYERRAFSEHVFPPILSPAEVWLSLLLVWFFACIFLSMNLSPDETVISSQESPIPFLISIPHCSSECGGRHLIFIVHRWPVVSAGRNKSGKVDVPPGWLFCISIFILIPIYPHFDLWPLSLSSGDFPSDSSSW